MVMDLAITKMNSVFDEFKQSPTLPIVMIVLLLAIMVLLYRRDPNPGLSNLAETPPAETPPPEKPENEDVEVYSLEKNECRMDKHGKVICPACNSKLGVPAGSTPPFKFNCPKCENKIRVILMRSSDLLSL